MSSHDIAEKAIKFRKPARMPYNFPVIGRGDFACVKYAAPMTRISDIEKVDEWGCVWKKWGVNSDIIGEPMGHPLQRWENLRNYQWPTPKGLNRYKPVKEGLEGAADKFTAASIEGILRRARFIRGFSNLMEDFYLHPEKVKELVDNILSYCLEALENYSRFNGIHCIQLPEDWGTQAQPFMSVSMFREFFKPVYKKLFDAIHSYGWVIRMHSDGKINDLIEEFIDCGLDLIELEQPRALGIEEIGRRYRGRICFEGCIDIQATLPTNNKELIKQEAKALIENWGTPDSGFLGVCYHDPDIDLSDETIKTAFDAFQQYDIWKDTARQSAKACT
ncbi:MAG: uroporphyrinogen decarboxylase family protein [Planctomycetota bacterium]